MSGYIKSGGAIKWPPFLDFHDAGKRYAFDLLHMDVDHEEKKALRQRVMTPHAHDVYHVVLYTKGKNHILIDGKQIQVEPGILIMTSPGMTHTFSPIQKGSLIYSEITFELARGSSVPLRLPWSNILSWYGGIALSEKNLLICLDPPGIQEARNIFVRILRELESPGRMSSAFAGQQILDLMMFVNRKCLPADTDSVLSSTERLARAKEYIESYYRTPIRISVLAGKAGFSAGHFQRLFRSEFGITPIDYQLQLRINAACTLLKNTQLRCVDIAGETGFSDLYYFSKIFKQRMKVTPTQYRERSA